MVSSKYFTATLITFMLLAALCSQVKANQVCYPEPNALKKNGKCSSLGIIQIGELRKRWLDSVLKNRLLAALSLNPSLPEKVWDEFDLPRMSEECGNSAGKKDLRWIDFRGVGERLDISGVDFGKADLTGAQFLHVNLTGVSFYGSILSETTFSDVTLNNTNFTCALLDRARFERVNGINTWFSSSSSEDISFLDQTFFRQSIFTEVLWKRPTFISVKFGSGTRFDEAMLREAKIEDSQFKYVRLDRSNLENARISGSSFNEVSLFGSNLSSVSVMDSCFKDVSFVSIVSSEPATLGSSILFSVNLAFTKPGQLGLRYVQWNRTNIEEGHCGIYSETAEDLNGRLMSSDSTVQLTSMHHRVRKLKELTDYYRADDGNNPEEAKIFRFLLQEAKRKLAWKEFNIGDWGVLSFHYLMHEHYRKPWYVLRALIVLIFFFAALLWAWFRMSQQKIKVKKNEEQESEISNTYQNIGFGSCIGLSLKWFFGVASNIIDIKDSLNLFGELDGQIDFEKHAKYILLMEAFVGLVWLVVASAVGVDILLQP